MTTRRNVLIGLVAGGVCVFGPLSTFAQQEKVRRIGFLVLRSRPTPDNPDYYGAFVEGMRELGYIEGKNLIIEWRAAEGLVERLPALAEDLARSNVEIIVTAATPGTLAAHQATRTIPIVTAAVTDPVSSGFAASLARPGGNVTGLTNVVADVIPKHIEILKTIGPGISRVAMLINADNPSHPPILKNAQSAARQVKLQLLPVSVRGSAEDIERGFAGMAKRGAQAVIVTADAFFTAQRQRVIQLAAGNRIPSIYPYREDVEAGGLISYGLNLGEFYRRAALYVDKILKGAKPGDLPFEQPMKFELFINRRTAKTLGLTIPQSLLISADKVIE